MVWNASHIFRNFKFWLSTCTDTEIPPLPTLSRMHVHHVSNLRPASMSMLSHSIGCCCCSCWRRCILPCFPLFPTLLCPSGSTGPRLWLRTLWQVWRWSCRLPLWCLVCNYRRFAAGNIVLLPLLAVEWVFLLYARCSRIVTPRYLLKFMIDSFCPWRLA